MDITAKLCVNSLAVIGDKMDKKILSLQIPKYLYDLLQDDASSNYMNISAFVRKLLMQLYEEKIHETKTTNL